MLSISDIYYKLWRETDCIDPPARKAAENAFGNALDRTGLPYSQINEITRLGYDMAVIAEEQGFIAGFQIACKLHQVLGRAAKEGCDE